MSDMMDVLHYFFEDDMRMITTSEQSDAIDEMRTNLYRLYDQPYRYGKKAQKSSGGRSYVTGDAGFPENDEFDPLNADVKPFVPATDFNPDSSMPFGLTLDAPLG